MFNQEDSRVEEKLHCRPSYIIMKGLNICWNCGEEFEVIGVVVSDAIVEEDITEEKVSWGRLRKRNL